MYNPRDIIDTIANNVRQTLQSIRDTPFHGQPLAQGA